MVTRRSFITTSMAASASLLTFNQNLLAALNKHKLQNIGYISGIIGNDLKKDWKYALKQSVDYGFTEIEIGKYLGESAPVFLNYCKEIGIRPVAGGIDFTTKEEELNQKLDNLAQLNINYAVVYWPWLVGGPFTLEDCKKSADLLNEMGLACKKRGLTLCWHNHNKEFTEMEEGLPFDYLMLNTDKDFVKCEMDLYWVKKGGADPLEMLEKYSGRYAILHVKDMKPGMEQDFECPGSGIIDFASIFKEAHNQGVNHYMVEHDSVIDGMACLKKSGQYLKNLKF